MSATRCPFGLRELSLPRSIHPCQTGGPGRDRARRIACAADVTSGWVRPEADGARVPIPDYQSLMLPLLRLAAQGEIRVRDAVRTLADQLGLSEDDRTQLLPSGGTTFGSRVYWAKAYMVQAKLLEITRRGYFKATPRGLQVLATDPQRVDNQVLAEFEEFRQFLERSEVRTPSGSLTKETPSAVAAYDATPEERIDDAHEKITKELHDQLLERILNSPPVFFERVVIDLIVAMGYGGSRADAGQRLGKSGDGGIDGIVNEDALGLDIVYLQAKRYAQGNGVGEEAIRGFSGALLRRGASKGVFVTTSHFSDAAREFVKAVAQQRIVLIDGDELTRLLVKHGVGIRTDRTIELKKLDLDYFDEEDTG
jgi:restriction system protein